MDKFFIQAAFKSLDDIDKKGNEEIKKALLESRNRERAKRKSKFKPYPLAKGEHLNPCAGNPDINIAVFNHATDVGASSPTTGLGEDNEGKYTVRRYGSWHYIIINPENGLALRVGDKVDYEKPESADNRILFFKSKDEAQEYIDQELSDSKPLEEKLPKDLATAYKNTKVYARRDTYKPERDILRPHKFTPYDYENSDYKEITKEEALKYRNKPKERYKLRVIIDTSINHTSDHPQVVIFNKDGKVISDFEVMSRMFPTTRTFKNSWNNIRYYSFTDIINAAYKIYETDEDSHPNKEAEERTNLLTSFTSYGSPRYEQWLNTINSELKKRNIEPLSISATEFQNLIIKSRYSYDDFLTKDEFDVLRSIDYSAAPASGIIATDNSPYGHYDDKRRLQKLTTRLEAVKAKLKANPDQSPLYRPEIDRIERELRLERTEKRKKQRLSDISASRNAKDYINYYLENSLHMSWGVFILHFLSALSKISEKLFEDKYANPAESDQTGYFADKKKVEELEKQINELQNQINSLQKELNDYKAKISDPEAGKKAQDEFNKQLEPLVDMFNRITDMRKQILDRSKKSSTGSVTEAVEKTHFNLNDQEDVEEAKKVRSEKGEKDDLIIIHPMLNHKKPEPGNAILGCKACDEVFYLDKNELKQDPDDPDTYNKDMKCENCGAEDGYTYIGDVATPDSASAESAMEERKDIDADDFSDNEDKEMDDSEPEEIVEESFDRLINGYLNKIYENANGYKTTKISEQGRNQYLMEGIVHMDNKDIKTSFLIELMQRDSKNMIFKGSNNMLTESRSPFKFIGKINKGKILFESMKYRYIENLGDKDHTYLIEGVELNK